MERASSNAELAKVELLLWPIAARGSLLFHHLRVVADWIEALLPVLNFRLLSLGHTHSVIIKMPCYHCVNDRIVLYRMSTKPTPQRKLETGWHYKRDLLKGGAGETRETEIHEHCEV